MKREKKILVFAIISIMCMYCLAGCGNDDNNSDTTNDGSTSTGQESTDGNGTGDNLMDDVSDGVKDVTDSIANGFDNYEDAHDYFLSTMESDNGKADFELRNENKEPQEYQNGSKGYYFQLHDVSNGNETMLGEYYVDVESGSIYQKNESGKAVLYNSTKTDDDGSTSGSEK